MYGSHPAGISSEIAGTDVLSDGLDALSDGSAPPLLSRPFLFPGHSKGLGTSQEFTLYLNIYGFEL